MEEKNHPYYFPILNGSDALLPWEMIKPYERQAYRNHSQSLERLAERGGLSYWEAWAVMNLKDFGDKDMRAMSEHESSRKLLNLIYHDRGWIPAGRGKPPERVRVLLTVEHPDGKRTVLHTAHHYSDEDKKWRSWKDDRELDSGLKAVAFRMMPEPYQG